MQYIAHIENDCNEKFGLPRQSGIVEELISTVVFESEYRNMDALKGLDGFSHIWLIWEFDTSNATNSWSPMVRPPRLGGNTRMGVFATRSPFRPNPIGLSCVKLLSISNSTRGPLLTVAGADLRNGTKIYDIKPYLPYVDSHPDAIGGFSEEFVGKCLNVEFPNTLLEQIPEEKRKAAVNLLAQDPRPSYHNDPNRIYGMAFANLNIRFRVIDDVIYVVDVSSSTSGS